MAWSLMNYLKRPRLQIMDTGNYYPERPYGPPPTSVFGNGGHPVSRALNKVAPGIYGEGQGVVAVSVGGSTSQTYVGPVLNSLSAPASSSASI